MKTMTLNLSEKEMKTLNALSIKKSLDKTQLLKQALRLYQKANTNKLFIKHSDQSKTELILI